MRFSAKALLIAACLLGTTTHAADLLDQVNSKTKLVTELKDVYRAFNIYHRITDQQELLTVTAEDGTPADIKPLLDKNIAECTALKQTYFADDSLKLYGGKYLDAVLRNYNLAKTKGWASAEFKADVKKAEKAAGGFLQYVVRAYPISRFVQMTEDDYWKTMDKDQYIKTGGHAELLRLPKAAPRANVGLLEKALAQTRQPAERGIYMLYTGDQYVKYADSLGDNAVETGIHTYKMMMDEQQYSIYLFEAWVKWRAVSQYAQYGLSKSSEIPNNEYDAMREKLAKTILEAVVKNEKDEMAINEFLVVATHDVVRRFGDYPYGNQVTVEYHQLFDEEK